MNEVLQRLTTIIERHYNDSRSDFARAIGKTPQNLNAFFRQDSKPGSDFLTEIFRLGFSSDWLLTGEGSMYADNEAGRALAQKFGASNEAIESNGQKEISTGETPEAIYARAKRWQLVREWLTETGTMTEWYFMANSVDGGISLEFLMFMEAVCPEPEELPDIQPFWAWLNKSGINTDWLKGGHGPAWNEEKWGAELRERLKKRFNRQRETSPATAALLEYSA
jgi:hypothetical protein